MKRILFIALLLCAFVICKGQSQDTIHPKKLFGLFALNKITKDTLTSRRDFSCGLKANYRLCFSGIGTAGVDYSLYFQYKLFGIIGGYSILYNLNTYFSGIGGYGADKLNGYHAGLIFKLAQFKKNNAFYLYIYEVRTSSLNPDYKPSGPNFQGNYYSETMNVFVFNPRYRNTFIKGVFSIELGLSFNFITENAIDQPYQINNKQTYATIGANVSLSLNVSALFNTSRK